MARRTDLVALLAAASVAAGGCHAGGDAREGQGPPIRHSAAPVGSWQALPPPPLAPGADAIGLTAGHQVVFLGGNRTPCAPMVSCDAVVLDPRGPGNEGMTRQVAAFDLRTGSWRRLSPVPGYVSAGGDAVYVAGRIIVSTSRGWFSYDLRHDAWSPFRARWRPGYGLSAVGDRIYGATADGSSALVYDARTRQWTRYPRDPIQPPLAGLTVSGTPWGPILGGYDATRPYDVHQGSPALVDAWDGTRWRRLPPTGQLERGWVWTGRRLVDPAVGEQDRGDEYTWHRAFPYGGVLEGTASTAAATWRPLPRALETAGRGWVTASNGWPADAAGDGWFVTDGRVYDDATGRAWPLPRPAGGPQVLASAVWSAGRLVVFGGASFTGQHLDALSNQAWVYTP